MNIGCIDIGSNTTRLLVADVECGRLREIANERVFTRIGASTSETGEIPAAKVAETAEVAELLAAQARMLGAERVTIVGTAAIREAPNRGDLERAVQSATGVAVRVLSGEQEAELSFAGACHAMEDCGDRLAVVDVGGGSTEIAIGPAHGRPDRMESLRVGSSLLRERHLCSDPPAPAELEAARAEVEAALAGIEPGPLDSAVAVGGTATSLHLVVGPQLTSDTLRAGLARLCAQPADSAAEELGLDPQRARLLPAGIVVLAAVAGWLGVALQIVRGGVREGAVLELAGAPG